MEDSHEGVLGGGGDPGGDSNSSESDDGADRTNVAFHLRRRDDNSVEKQAPSTSGDHILSVRIPVSTLMELNTSSEFLLDFNDDEVSSGMLRKRHADNDEEDKLAVRKKASFTSTYQKNPFDSSELIHVGDSSQQLTIQLSKEVEHLGRKARERLEEEKRKRREIVRLEQDPEQVATSTTKRTKASFAEAVRKQRPRLTPVTKRKLVDRFSDSFAEQSVGTIDTWTPNVSRISQCAEGERSSVIRLHGLPLSVKPESIRRFFSGLHIDRVFVLLSNPSCIPEWDERMHPSQLTVERHEPCFRVYVKFASSPVANLALARSEEFLFLETEDDQKRGVHIGMTKISKSTAVYLQHNLAVDGVVGCPLHETLDKEESQLGERAIDLLWTMAIRDLSLLSPIQVDSKTDRTNDLPWHVERSNLNPVVLSEYQKLAHHYNSLVDAHDEMERSRMPLGLEEWDPKRSMDAAVRLSRAAASRLLSEINHVKLMLYRARVERRRSTDDSSGKET